MMLPPCAFFICINFRCLLILYSIGNTFGGQSSERNNKATNGEKDWIGLIKALVAIYQKMSLAETGVTLTILFLLLIISLTGNILVILSYLLSERKRLRGYTHLLIFNLAISDTLITCLSLPSRISLLFKVDWGNGFTSCSVVIAFSVFFFTSTNYNLFLVTLDRYLGIIHAVKYRAKGSRKKVKIAILISWILSFIIGFFPLTGAGQGENKFTSDKILCTFGAVLSPPFNSFVSFVTFLIPWAIMIGMYVQILRVGLPSVRTGMRSNIHPNNGQMVSQKARKREARKMKSRANELRLARVVFLVLALYTICMLPISVMDLIQSYASYRFPDEAFKVALMFAYCNSAVNPPIYAANIEYYRKMFLELLTCKTCKKHFQAKLHISRNSGYQNRVSNSPRENGETRWQKTLDVPGSALTLPTNSMIHSSEYNGSTDDLSVDGLTDIPSTATVFGDLKAKSVSNALYASTRTALSVILSEEELSACIFDVGSYSQVQIISNESAL